MIAATHPGLGLLSPQLIPAVQRKLAFKRYYDALAQGDEEEAADAFANWQRLGGVVVVRPIATDRGKGAENE